MKKEIIAGQLFAAPDAISKMAAQLMQAEHRLQKAQSSLKELEASLYLNGVEGKNAEARAAAVLMQTMGDRENVRRAKEARDLAELNHQLARDNFDALKSIAALLAS